MTPDYGACPACGRPLSYVTPARSDGSVVPGSGGVACLPCAEALAEEGRRRMALAFPDRPDRLERVPDAGCENPPAFRVVR